MARKSGLSPAAGTNGDEVDTGKKRNSPSRSVVGRPPLPLPKEKDVTNEDEEMTVSVSCDVDGLTISHARSKSAPALNQVIKNGHRHSSENANDPVTSPFDEDDDDDSDHEQTNGVEAKKEQRVRPQFIRSADNCSAREVVDGNGNNSRNTTEHVYDIPEGDDYMAIYETIDR